MYIYIMCVCVCVCALRQCQTTRPSAPVCVSLDATVGLTRRHSHSCGCATGIREYKFNTQRRWASFDKVFRRLDCRKLDSRIRVNPPVCVSLDATVTACDIRSHASEPNLLRHTPHAADLQGGSSEWFQGHPHYLPQAEGMLLHVFGNRSRVCG